MKNIVSHNQKIWDDYVKKNNPWTCPVSEEQVQEAKKGILKLYLTPLKAVPHNWFPKNIHNKKILCLASGGGQQSILLAASGADVTVFDLSQEQLSQDQKTAERENLSIKTIQGDMQDLSLFENEVFDIIFCPVSITYIPTLTEFFDGVYRILKPQGIFMLGATNPHIYLYDLKKWDDAIYEIAHALPYCNLDDLDENEQKSHNQAIEYSHTLEAIISGQLQQGFVMTDFFEDRDEQDIAQYFQNYFATRAIKNL